MKSCPSGIRCNFTRKHRWRSHQPQALFLMRQLGVVAYPSSVSTRTHRLVKLDKGDNEYVDVYIKSSLNPLIINITMQPLYRKWQWTAQQGTHLQRNMQWGEGANLCRWGARNFGLTYLWLHSVCLTLRATALEFIFRALFTGKQCSVWVWQSFCCYSFARFASLIGRAMQYTKAWLKGGPCDVNLWWEYTQSVQLPTSVRCVLKCNTQ